MLTKNSSNTWSNARQFFQKFLNHRIKHDDKRSLELLSELVFPSEPQISLSAVFLDKLSLLSMEKDSEDLPAAIGTVVLSLWSRCIKEKYVNKPSTNWREAYDTDSNL